MKFDNLPISKLDSQHPDYMLLAPVWRTLDTLRRGFPAIKANINKYLPKRPVEDDELYTLRTAKLAYSPVMAHVVHTYTGKMAMAGIDFPESVDKIWDLLRTSNANPEELKRDELTLVAEIFTSLLYFGRSHVMVDVPEAATLARSSFELRKSKLTPYFTSIPPLEVINWGKGWFVLKQFVSECEPFAPVRLYVQYSYIGNGVVCRYKIPAQVAMVEDSEGNKYPDILKVLYKGEWIKPDDDMLWEPTSIVKGAGIDRLVTTEVSEDKWLCLSLANKQIQHLRIENAWTDAGYLSGTVQRVFTPADPVIADDPRVAYDTENIAKELEKAGNAHILIGKGYSFVESSGTALGNLEQMLDKIEAQILKIANLSFISGDSQAISQSGISKKLDMSLLDGTLKEYGNILIDAYNTLLAKVAQLMSIAPVEVGGLTDFSEKDPTAIIAIIQVLASIPDFPPLARLIIYRQLLTKMDITLSPEDTEELELVMAEPVIVPDHDNITTETSKPKPKPKKA